jgi:hypothetical protein
MKRSEMTHANFISGGHNHKWYAYTNGLAGAYTIDANELTRGASSFGESGGTVDIPSVDALTRDFYTDNQNHLPPYINVIIWRRTS